jgi:cell wall-associated NlpC family hydrolase
MRIRSNLVLVALFGTLSLYASWGQGQLQTSKTSSAGRQWSNTSYARNAGQTLSPDEGLSVIAAALDPKTRRYSRHDCSHLVHAIYKRAGFSYAYASSAYLYAGMEGFQRVTHPQPGDLVVWRGHVGIVIQPSRHVFFSYLRRGPGVDDYEAPYWTGRGRPRFYRYIKSDACAGCAHSRQGE